MSRFIRTVALMTAVLLPCGAAYADGTKIAVVNTQSVMKDSTAFKSINDQLEAKQKAYQADISKQQDALQKNKQELDKQQAALAKEAFAEKVKDFEGKVDSMQKEARTKKMTLDSAYQQSISQIEKTVSDIVADMAKEKGFNVALPLGPLLFADPSLDITADVTKRLNEKLPNYTVKFEAPKTSDKK